MHNSHSVKISDHSYACETSLSSKTSFLIALPVAGLSIAPEQPAKLQSSIKWQQLDHLLSPFMAAQFQKEELVLYDSEGRRDLGVLG